LRRILAAAVFAAISASLLSAAPAQVQTPIKIMVGGIDKQIYLPAKLAAQLGFFKEQGLDVELFNSTSGSQAATALLAREVQGVVGFYDHTIDLQSKGKFITDVVQFGIAPGEVALAKSAVLFVTHDLDEAILLADRVAVLTTRPARVKSVHTIDLPRPRNVATLRYDEKFIAIARKISDDLREEVLRARAGH
jgi:ABC-type nitrate/sulfonate/bicarbonate transport system substrate-binding protein